MSNNIYNTTVTIDHILSSKNSMYLIRSLYQLS